MLKIVKNVKKKIYNHLVPKGSEIDKAYTLYKKEDSESQEKGKFQSCLYLLSLNLEYKSTGRIKSLPEDPEESAQLKFPEYKIKKRKSVDELAEYLADFDVVSFDVFDTLLLRAVSNPKDLFILLGNRLKIVNFKTIRVNAELEARKYTDKPYNEVDIHDIYERVNMKCGINPEEGISAEIQAEKDVLSANPYMLAV